MFSGAIDGEGDLPGGGSPIFYVNAWRSVSSDEWMDGVIGSDGTDGLVAFFYLSLRFSAVRRCFSRTNLACRWRAGYTGSSSETTRRNGRPGIAFRSTHVSFLFSFEGGNNPEYPLRNNEALNGKNFSHTNDRYLSRRFKLWGDLPRMIRALLVESRTGFVGSVLIT